MSFSLNFFFCFPKGKQDLFKVALNLQVNAFDPPYRIYSRTLSISFLERCALLRNILLITIILIERVI